MAEQSSNKDQKSKIVVTNKTRTIEQALLAEKLIEDLKTMENIEKVFTEQKIGNYKVGVLIIIKECNKCIIVECDEYQHYNYDKKEELNRINSIFNVLKNPDGEWKKNNLLVIRFNPHEYKNKQCFKYGDKWSKTGLERYKTLSYVIDSFVWRRSYNIEERITHRFLNYDKENVYTK